MIQRFVSLKNLGKGIRIKATALRWMPDVMLLTLLAGTVCLAPGAPMAPAAPPLPQRIAEKFIGAWLLTSVEGNSPVRPMDFDHPTGLIIYDRSGWMSVQLAVHGLRKPFAKGETNGTREEKAQAFDNYSGYYGRYTVDVKAETVTHHIADYSYPGFQGQDFVRWFELKDDNHLVLIPTEDNKGGRLNRQEATFRLTWERVR